jgi:arylsulfatase A-like enzyme
MAVIPALFYLLQSRWSIPGRSRPASEVGRWISPLKPSDLNILLVTLDTTRADHIGCYGYPMIQTPNIDGLAAEGILFQNATSQCPLTLPAHSSIFTETYPSFHGVRDNGGFYLGEDQVTLAEVAREAGCATSAFIGAFVLDSRFGRVLEYLRGKGRLGRTVVVVVGDHGESLGEHQESAHGFFVYDATVSVPLIIRIPSAALRGKKIAAQVQNIDIMPTLCELLGLPVPQAGQGQSLLRLIAGRKPVKEYVAYSESYYPRYHYGWSELKSLRTSRYKFIKAPRPELYDLTLDPRERDNLFGRDSSLSEECARQLETLEKKTSQQGIGERAPQQLDDDTREKLMALGYIDGSPPGPGQYLFAA